MSLRRIGRAAVAALLSVTLVDGAGYAHAATFTVNNAADTTDGSCDTSVGGCTLREAIEAAVATPGRDSIVFDPAVFPAGPGSSSIELASALPVVADPAGTVIDGAGAAVRISGGGTIDEGLVFTSAPGVPLTKVTVANVIVASFTGTAVHICGGTIPTCEDDVSTTLVRNVVANAIADGDGIRIEGHLVSKARVVDSVAFHVGGFGIRVFGDPSIVGARIEGSTARDCGEGGILLRAIGDLDGGVITDSVALQNGGIGAGLAGGNITKPKITNVVAYQNDGNGILVQADGSATAAAITDVAASKNNAGIQVTGTGANIAPALSNVAADGNTADGIALLGPTTAAKITGVASVGNLVRGITLPDDTSGAKLSDAVVVGNGSDGLFLHPAASTLQQLRAHANGGDGISLGTGAGGNTLRGNAANANDASGIAMADQNGGNVVQKNVALGNTADDLFDGNANCDANTWTANVFRSGSLPCIH